MFNEEETFDNLFQQGEVNLVFTNEISQLNIKRPVLAPDTELTNCELSKWYKANYGEKKLMKILKQKPKMRCDLHGCNSEKAWDTLDEFLANAIARSETVVEVVHGAGEGVLKVKTRGWLQKCNYVLGFIEPKHNPNTVIVKLKLDRV